MHYVLQTMMITAFVGVMMRVIESVNVQTREASERLLSVLVTSSAVQGGHGMLPLLALSKSLFFLEKPSTSPWVWG